MVRMSKWFAGAVLGLLVASGAQAQTGGFGRSTLLPSSTQSTQSNSTTATTGGTTATTDPHQAAMQDLFAQIQALSVIVAEELGITATTPEEQLTLFAISAQIYFALMRESRAHSGFGGGGRGSGSGRGFGGGGGRASGTGGFGGGSLLSGTSQGTGTSSGRNR